MQDYQHSPRDQTTCPSSNIQTSSLNKEFLQNQGIPPLIESNYRWEALENLTLAENHIGKIGAKILSCDPTFKNLKRLDISQNHIGNDGVKYITTAPIWTELKVLIMNNVSIDYHGVIFLSANESWKMLQELHLQDNPLIGELGAMTLSYNVKWKALNHLNLINSNVGRLGIEFLRRNKVWKTCFLQVDDPKLTLNNSCGFNNMMTQLGRRLYSRVHSRVKYDFFNDSLDSKLVSPPRTFIENRRRGGKGREQINEVQNEHIFSILTKTSEYIKKNRADKHYDDEQNLYIEPLGRKSSSTSDSNLDLFDLATEIKKRLLDYESELKLLLLSGEVGVGKTSFCKYLQRLLLPEIETVLHESDEKALWIPIFVDLSCSKALTHFHSGTEALTISDILSQELSFTESEIKLLYQSELNNMIPCFLFIFDEFRIVQNSPSPCTPEDCILNNFCRSVGFDPSMKNFKIIVACRSETLPDIPRRELLFGLLDNSTKKLIPNSFSEFVIEPFSSTQVSSYLKRYMGLKHPEELDNPEISSTGFTVWSWVKNCENVIDSCKLKELVRVPLFLSMFIEVLLQKMKEGANAEEEENNSNPTPHKKLIAQKGKFSNSTIKKIFKRMNSSQLFDLYTKQSIDVTIKRALSSKNEQVTEEKMHFLFPTLKQHLQILALNLSNYSLTQTLEIKAEEQKEIDGLLCFCPLIQIDNNKGRKEVKFIHKSLRDYFVATKIEEEIIRQFGNECSATENSPEMILNQKCLFDGLMSISVIQFLVDAASEEKFSAALIQLIQKSKLPRNYSRKPERITHATSNSQENRQGMVTAATNAITILNAAGNDFQNLDFSNISIAGAILRNGRFAGTDFTGCDLQGVNFSGAWLKDTKFVRANLQGVQFGVIPNLSFDKEATYIVHSPCGEQLAVATQNEILVFQKNLDGTISHTEFRKIEGCTGLIFNISFSQDGQYLIAGAEDGTICIWNFGNGERVQVLSGHTSSVTRCEFSHDKRHIVSIDESRIINKWSTSGSGWALSFQLHPLEHVTNCGFVPSHNQLIFLGNKNHGPTFYNAITGRYTCKFKTRFEYQATHTNFNSEGNQVVIGRDNGSLLILDGIRSHLIKFLKDNCADCVASLQNPKFGGDGTQIISTIGRTLEFRNAADSEYEGKELDDQLIHYSIDPVGNGQIAVLLRGKKVMFTEVEALKNDHRVTPITGVSHRGLCLAGTNIDDSRGLSDENIMLFDQRGDYYGFGKEKIKELILNSQTANLAKITTIHLCIGSRGSQCAQVIGRNSNWINLESLNLSGNGINDGDTVALGKNMAWKNLQELILSSNHLSDKTAAAIAGNPCWKSLRKLHLASNKINDAGAKSLGKNLIWENLEELDLSQNTISDEGAAILGQNKSWKHLKKLDLSFNRIGDKSAEAIARNQTWSCLEELSLSNNKIGDKGAVDIGGNTTWSNLKLLSLESNKIGDLGATAIAKNSSWINLEELYVFDNSISSKCVSNMKKNKAWTKMKLLVWNADSKAILGYCKGQNADIDFSLYSCNLSDNDAIIIAKKKTLTNLTDLIMSENIIGDRGAVAMGRNVYWNELKDLTLRQNFIGDEGAISIGSNTTWTKLQTLSLAENAIGDKGAVIIGNNTTWNELRELYLNSNRIGDEGAIAIGSNNTWSNLSTLYLYENMIGDEGAIGIGNNINWMKLKVLRLERNKIGDEGATAIGSNKIWTNLKDISLGENEIGDKGAEAIGANTAWRKLEELDLNTNKVSDKGAISIASNTTWNQLTSLSLKKNEIGNKGASGIGKNAAWTNLQNLDLSCNKIGDQGAIAIGLNSIWSQLTCLHLEENEIGDQGAVGLSENATWEILHELHLNGNKIGDIGAMAIGASKAWKRLKGLYLSDNKIGDKGAVAIGNNKTWCSLSILDISRNKISDKGAISLGSNTTWTDLYCLRLEENEIGNKGAVAIGNNMAWVALGKLYLNGNKIGEEGVLSIANNATWSNLEELRIYDNNFSNKSAINQAFTGENCSNLECFVSSINGALKNLLNSTKNQILTKVCLSSKNLTDKDMLILADRLPSTLEAITLSQNNIGDRGAEYIGDNSSWKKLKKLDLSANSISYEGAAAIGQNKTWKNLEELNLSHNQICDTGVRFIQKSITFRNLTVLNLSANQISSKGAIAIGKNVRWIQLEELYLNENGVGDEGAAALGQNTAWRKLKKFEILENANITKEGKNELQMNIIFGSFVCV